MIIIQIVKKHDECVNDFSQILFSRLPNFKTHQLLMLVDYQKMAH